MVDFLSYIPFGEILKYLNQFDIYTLSLTCKAYKNLFEKKLSRFKEWINGRCKILTLDFNNAIAMNKSKEIFIAYNAKSLIITLQDKFKCYPRERYCDNSSHDKFIPQEKNPSPNINYLINEFFDFLDEKYNLRAKLREGDLVWIKLINTLPGSLYRFPVYCYYKSPSDISYKLHPMLIDKNTHSFIIPIENSVSKFPLHYWENYLDTIYPSISEISKKTLEIEYSLFGHRIKYFIKTNPSSYNMGEPMYLHIDTKEKFSAYIWNFINVSARYYIYGHIF